MINYQLIRSARKTISVSVNTFGEITVRAPKRCPDKEISEFIVHHSDWISSKIKKAESTMPDIVDLKSLKYIYILGKKYEIADSSVNKKIVFTDNILYLPDCENKEKKLINWLKKYALEYFTERCAALYPRIQNLIKNNFKEIKIINSKTKWGACDINKIIYFNWRAVMLDPSLIDYLIYHELCHLKFLNHSKDYWALAGQITDYKKHRKLLKEKNYFILLYR